MSAKGIAQIAVVMDLVPQVGLMFRQCLTKPLLLSSRAPFSGWAASCEGSNWRRYDAETLGGGDTHTRLSGVADYLARDDEHALTLARQIVHNLGLK